MTISPGNGFTVPPVVPGAVDRDVVDERDVDPALRDPEAERDLDADRGEARRGDDEPEIAVAPEQR